MSSQHTPEIFTKPYESNSHEGPLYDMWERSGFFNPDACIANGITEPNAPVFSMVLPPPNVTGTLHMGSALMLAVEDTFVRHARMTGKRTLWIPGTDSAAIATQARVEKDIQKEEGKSRHDLGREELLKRIDVFVEQNKNTMLSQMRAMGSSLDWSRYAYTMDAPRYKAVMEAFVRMYEAGLIYRANRIVNWDPKGQTTISDDEIVYEERKSTLYTFKYSKDFPISISTTRPETKVGDTAVAVNPQDERYQEYIGKEYSLVFCDVPITVKIVADDSVDKDFGTGALGVTPAHALIDWEIADRHNLARPAVINEYAKMSVDGRLNGKKVTEAREMVVAWLQEEGLLEHAEEVTQNVATAERTGGIIEPLPKLQWWIDVDKKFPVTDSKISSITSGEMVSLKELMLKVADGGDVSFVSERYEKTYRHWAHSLRPWCISRQIWFGHRIPVWYRGTEIRVQIESPGSDWEQEADVLDTWFSSALWTMSTLGWPEKTSDLATYHPTSMIESGYDILFFWIARMILMSGFFLGEVPFKTVYLHGIVRDGQGRKISKSLGNNIDPVDMAAKYGMDAVRVSLIMGTAPGTDSKISEDKIRGYKHFANKLWNITRFVVTNVHDVDVAHPLTPTDQQLLTDWKAVRSEIDYDIAHHNLHLAGEKIYHYVWDVYASVLLEESKTIFADSDTNAQSSRKRLLHTIFLESIKILHPFMPYVTEAIWQHTPKYLLHGEPDILMVAKWPTA